MAYKVIILYQLYMPSYFLGTFTEYPKLRRQGIAMPNRNHSHFLSINNFYVIHCSNVPHSRKITKILQPKIT